MTAPRRPDWTDPCQRADALREAFYALLAGEKAVSTSYMANGVSREVRFGQSDLATLERELRLAEQLCAGGGTAPRRINTIILSTSKGL